MATFRVGVGSFNINDGSVGIGTEGAGHGNLKVEGVTKANSIDVLGVSTFTRYSGFNVDNSTITNKTLDLSGEFTSTGDIIIDDNATLTVGLGSTASVGSPECLSIKHHFSVPSGDSTQRDEVTGYIEGTMRYNTDLETLEFFNGEEWKAFNFQLDIQNSPASRGTAYFGGGDTPVLLTNVSKVNFRSLGNAINFGELTVARTNPGGGANEIRGIWAGGEEPGATDEIDYLAMCSGGNGADFGNLASNHRYLCGASSSTRACFGAGSTPSSSNVIQYVEIMTTGNAIDFGDLMGNGMINSGSWQTPINAFWVDAAVDPDQEIQVVKIASKGNTVSWGNRGLYSGDANGDAGRGTSNSTRGLYFGAGQTTSISCADLTSQGLSYDFGEMTQAKYGVGASASPIRAIVYGGWTPTKVDTMEYLTFATMGDGVDFGDATHKVREVASNVSDCHGGIGGY